MSLLSTRAVDGSTAARAGQPWVQTLSQPLAGWVTWGTYLTSLCLSYLICYKGQEVIISTSGGAAGIHCVYTHSPYSSAWYVRARVFPLISSFKRIIYPWQVVFQASGISFPTLQIQSWFTHKRLDLEVTELSTGQGECLRMFIVHGRGMGAAQVGQCFPGVQYVGI